MNQQGFKIEYQVRERGVELYHPVIGGDRKTKNERDQDEPPPGLKKTKKKSRGERRVGTNSRLYRFARPSTMAVYSHNNTFSLNLAQLKA